MSVVTRGLIVGAALMIGPFIIRRMVQGLRPRAYGYLIDAVLIAAAGGMFIAVQQH